MKQLSHIAGHLKGQKMFQILARARQMEQVGKSVIHFEIGDPDFDSPPNVIEAACTALKSGHTHYVESSGLYEFRDWATKMTLRSRGFRPSISQILVTPGANMQLYLVIACTVNPGDEVIITDPCFVSYTSIIELCGAKAVRISLKEENGFRLDPEDLKKSITSKTRLVIINSPHNPTGSVMTQNDMKEVFNIVEKSDLYLLSDEVYGRMVYDDDENQFSSPSVFDQCKERTIIAHSFSKSYAMTGWRVGAVTGPENLIERMGLLLETITSCVSPFVQYAAIEAMSSSQEYVSSMVQAYRRRRDLMLDGLNAIPGITCLKPGGSFYVFPNIKGTGLNSESFSEKLLMSAGIATCPGSYFGPSGEGYVRFCYARSENEIHEALERMQRVFS